jgi:hypothetical protein
MGCKIGATRLRGLGLGAGAGLQHIAAAAVACLMLAGCRSVDTTGWPSIDERAAEMQEWHIQPWTR